MNRESERKRLVELMKQGDKTFADKYTGKVMSHIDEIYGFIADHLLDDGWMRPPVKVGQTVYIVAQISQKISEAKVIGVWTYDNVCNIITDQGILLLNDIGVHAFTSREDAVKALGGDGE